MQGDLIFEDDAVITVDPDEQKIISLPVKHIYEQLDKLEEEEREEFMKLSRKESCLELYKQYEEREDLPPEVKQLQLEHIKVKQIVITNAIGNRGRCLPESVPAESFLCP